MNIFIPPHMMINGEVQKTTASYLERSLWPEFKVALQRMAGFDSMQGGTGTAQIGILLEELGGPREDALCLTIVPPGA